MVKWSRLIALWLLLQAPSALAGQLHYSYIELSSLPEQAGYAVAVLVALVNAQRRNVRLQVRIKQRWGKVPETLAQNGEMEVQLNPGVEWTDPHMSPIEHRVRGFLTHVTANSEVVLVPMGGVYEALPYDAAMKRKLDMVFSPTGIEDYKKNAAAKDLIHDLDDEDLGEQAAEILRARKLLRAEHLLGVSSAHFYTRVSHFLTHANAVERAEFLRDSAKYLKGKPYDDRASQFQRLLYYAPLELTDLPPLAELLDALNLTTEQANGDFCLLKDKLVERFKAADAKAMAALFVPTMVRFAIHRPGYRSDDPGTAIFLAGLDQASQPRMVRALLSASYKGARFDNWLFETAMPVAEKAPTRDYLPEFAGLDLNRISGTNWQVDALVKILRTVLKLVEIDPGSVAAVRKAIDPMCANQSIISLLNLTSPEGKALLERYQKLSPKR